MKILMLLFIVLSVVACSSLENENARASAKPTAKTEAASKGYALGEEVKGIFNYNISGWRYVSRYSVIIPSRPNLNYLLMLDRACFGLNSTELIATTSTVNQLRAGFDSIIINNINASSHKCRVNQIYKITKNITEKE